MLLCIYVYVYVFATDTVVLERITLAGYLGNHYLLSGFKRSVALYPQIPVHTTRTDRTGATRTDRTGVRSHISSTRTDHTDRTGSVYGHLGV